MMKNKERLIFKIFVLILTVSLLFLQKGVAAQEAERHFKSGRISYINKNFDKAKSYFKTALEINPEYYEAWCELAICYMETEDFKEAIGFLKESLKLDPDFPKANYAIAVAYLKKKEPNLELAEEYGNRALRLGYNVPDWFFLFFKQLKGKGL